MSSVEVKKLIIPPFVPRKTISTANPKKILNGPVPCITSDWKIYNHTGQTIYVLLRNGLHVELPPTNPFTSYGKSRGVTAVFGGTIPLKAKVGIPNLREDELQYKTQLQYLAERIKDDMDVPQGNREYGRSASHSYKHEIVFELSELELAEEGIYSPELDVVITTHYDVYWNALHPYTELGRHRRLIKSTKTEEIIKPFSFFINDHRYLHNVRYLRFGKSVHRVPVMRDPEQREGFYATVPEHIDKDGRVVEGYDIVISMVEATKLFPLFTSLEDAHLGDQIQLDILDREYRNTYARMRQQELDLRARELTIKEKELNSRRDELDVRRSEAEYKRLMLTENRAAEYRKIREDEERRNRDDESRRIVNDITERRALRGEVIDLVKSLGALLATGLTIYKLVKSK